MRGQTTAFDQAFGVSGQSQRASWLVTKPFVIDIIYVYLVTRLDFTTEAFVHIFLPVAVDHEADAFCPSQFRMAVQRVTVTYAASPNLQSQTDLWDQLRSAIAAQLPLRNLHWKSASRSSIRTVQELPINLVSFDSVPGEHTSQIPGSWLERPLLNFYVLTCDVRSKPRARHDISVLNPFY
jgi:hypothetical protein